MSYDLKPRIGLLPLMLEMYRKYVPQIPQKQKSFIDEVKNRFQDSLDVINAEISSTNGDVEKAIKLFEDKDVDLIVVLFISYATSLSVLKPLLETTLPVLMFSTSSKSGFGHGFTMDDILLNHGIHGYMDLSNVLRRFGRKFIFVAGKKDDLMAIGKINEWAMVSSGYKKLKNTKIGLVGYTFDGMGDFGVDTTRLYGTIGPEVVHIPLDLIAEKLREVRSEEIEREIKRDLKNYDKESSVSSDILEESERFYIALKRIVEEMELNGITMHFQGVLENPDIKTVPFLAISKLQDEGIVYAGEGDVLGVTGGLILKVLNREVYFTEPFCPSFDNNSILMAHMGESNPVFGKKVVLRRKKFAFGRAIDPVIMDIEIEEGEATFINFGIGAGNDFQIITFSGDVSRGFKASPDVDMPYFFFKPRVGLAEFLERYSCCGGTHHLSMSRGSVKSFLDKMAYLLGVGYIDLDLL